MKKKHQGLLKFFFLINIYPGASNLAELVQMEPWHNTKTKTLKH